MPLYEYTCQDCNETFDVLRTFSEADDAIACEQCASENTVRGLSTFAVHGGTTAAGAREPARQTANGGGCCGGGACGCAL